MATDGGGEVARLRAEVASLRAQLRAALDARPPVAQQEGALPALDRDGSARPEPEPGAAVWRGEPHGLTKDQVERYSRQLVLSEFGVAAQARLCRAAVLVVGAGGLGSPAALYLAAAGVGRLGIVDCDTVERSNLHRQVIHTEAAVGEHKATSAAAACTSLNGSIEVKPHCCRLMPSNALELVSSYDAVVDASDNAFTRYLLSDACAVARRPLVSGAALGTEGHLTVYCHGEGGPCHRCLFPEAPRPEACGRCSDAGVLGPVPGIVGTLQAMEAIKVVTGAGQTLSRRLLLLDALQGRMHTVKLRSRVPGCAACGTAPIITRASLPAYDYAAFTGAQPNDAAPPQLHLLPDAQRLSPHALRTALRGSTDALVVDVRPRQHFDIAHIPGSLSCPYDVSRPDDFRCHIPAVRAAASAAADPAGGHEVAAPEARNGSSETRAGMHAPCPENAVGQDIDGAAGAMVLPDTGVSPGPGSSAAAASACSTAGGPEPARLLPAVSNAQAVHGGDADGAECRDRGRPVYVVCRRGNDSQRAVQALHLAGIPALDMEGGLQAWAAVADPAFPLI